MSEWSKGKRILVKDSLLSQYLGRWESDQLIISFDSIGKSVLNEKREVSVEVLYGRLWLSNLETNATMAFNVNASTISLEILNLHSEAYQLNSNLKFDTQQVDVLNWYKAGVLSEVINSQNVNGKDLFHRTKLEPYEMLPSIIPLSKVK